MHLMPYVGRGTNYDVINSHFEIDLCKQERAHVETSFQPTEVYISKSLTTLADI